MVPTPGHPRACHGTVGLHHRHQAVPTYGAVTAPDPGMCANQPRAPRAPGARPDQNCGIDSPILALAARTRARARGRSRRFGRRSSMRPAIGAAFGSLSRHLTRNGGRCQSQQAELVLKLLFQPPPTVTRPPRADALDVRVPALIIARVALRRALDPRLGHQLVRRLKRRRLQLRRPIVGLLHDEGVHAAARRGSARVVAPVTQVVGGDRLKPPDDAKKKHP